MSQGFETKSADSLQNLRGQRKPKEIADELMIWKAKLLHQKM